MALPSYISNEPSEFDRVPTGYPKLAAFMTKDKDYIIFRKFRALGARNILYLQAQLCDLEIKLQQIDGQLKTSDVTSLKSWVNFSKDGDRYNLIKEIENQLDTYYSAVLKYEQVLRLGIPDPSHIEDLRSWIRYDESIIDSSKDYTTCREPRGELQKRKLDATDLVQLNTPADSWLSNAVRRSLLGLLFTKDFVFCNDDKSKAIMFYAGPQIDVIVTGIFVISIVILTTLAMISLNVEQHFSIRFGLIGLFTLFAAVILTMAGAKKAEVMMGTVGYAAILVVFVSRNTQY